MNLDPVRFFFEQAARHLVPGPHEDPWTAAGAVFNRGYRCAIPMAQYASKTLAQARRAQSAQRQRMLAELARYRIVDAVIAGETDGATTAERKILGRLRDVSRAREPARERPAARRPAPGSVVLARKGLPPFTIANVAWASSFVEQRWMHQDRLGSLIRRLAEDPCDEPFVLAVAGRPRYSPASLAFSSRQRLAICLPDRSESVDLERVRRLDACLGAVHPKRRHVLEFRSLCRARALTSDIAPVDRKLLRLADAWRLDVHALHALLLGASDLEIEALAPDRED